MNKPSPGNIIYTDIVDGVPADTWIAADGTAKRITDDVTVDASAPEHFIVSAKPPPTIFPAVPPWSVKVKDDDESTGSMRRGTVVSEQ